MATRNYVIGVIYHPSKADQPSYSEYIESGSSLHAAVAKGLRKFRQENKGEVLRGLKIAVSMEKDQGHWTTDIIEMQNSFLGGEQKVNHIEPATDADVEAINNEEVKPNEPDFIPTPEAEVEPEQPKEEEPPVEPEQKQVSSAETTEAGDDINVDHLFD